jgi:hypothetical protein
MTTSCDAFHPVQSGDTCSDLAAEYNINESIFTRGIRPWELHACILKEEHMSMLKYSLLPLVVLPSGTLHTTHATITTASAIQTGLVIDCDKFYDS